MATFFANTWFLWWMVAVVIVVRWFHVAAVDEIEEQQLPARASDEGTVLGSGKLIEDTTTVGTAS